MYYAIDIILLAVLVLFVIFGSRKGFVRMLLETLGSIVSVVAGWFVAAKYTDKIYASYFKEGVIRGIDGRLSGSETIDAGTASFYSIPERLRGIAALLGFDEEGMSKSIDAQTASSAEALEKNVVGPIVTVILKVLVFIAVVIILSIIIRFIIGIIDRASKLPTIKKADATLGGILGFITGVIFVMILAELVFALSGLLNNEIIADKISASFVIRLARDTTSYVFSLIKG